MTKFLAIPDSKHLQKTIELFPTQSQLLMTLGKEDAFENILGKRENADNQHFLLFPKCFLPFPRQI